MTGFYSLAYLSLGASPIPLVVDQDDIVFDGYSLSNGVTVTCTQIDYDNQGKIDLNTFDFPRDDGGGVLSKYYRGRNIKVKVTLVQTTQSLFNTLLDDFKKGISATEGYLDIRVNDDIRRIKATVTALVFDKQHYNINFVNAEITFTALEPFFYAYNSQSWLFEGKTITFDSEITNAGSANTDPVFYVIFGAGTATSAVAITAFGRTITVTTSFVSGDVLIINADTKTVTKNGTALDYTGIFPIFETGSCPFTTTFTGTTLADVTLILAKNYL